MSAAPPAHSEWIHATSVAVDGNGVMITGPSGSGKSGLALELIALGAVLIADDLSRVAASDNGPVIHAPDRMAGVIEARGLGLLRMPHMAHAPLRLIVDMGTDETQRLPEARHQDVHGVAIARVGRVDARHFPASIIALAKGGCWRE